jgi:hypothetical protein
LYNKHKARKYITATDTGRRTRLANIGHIPVLQKSVLLDKKLEEKDGTLGEGVNTCG